MKTKPKIKEKIYACRVQFEYIVRFLLDLKDLESEHNFQSMTYLYTKDGATYSYDSAAQLFDPKEEHNINYLKDHEVIVGISISKLGVFDFYIDKDGRTSLSKAESSVLGQVIVDKVIRTLKLRTTSIVGYFTDHMWPVFLLQGMAFVSGVINDQLLYAGISSILMLVILMSTFSLEKCSIVMGTSKDGFFVRKRDDIVIATVSLVVGFLLGIFASSLAS